MSDKEDIKALISKLPPEIGKLVKLGLQIQEQQQKYNNDTLEDSEIGFESTRTIITDKGKPEYFESYSTEIIERDGKIGRIKNYQVWDCGHSQNIPLGGVDAFGHAVCESCLRWCDIGSHPCCVLDSKLRSDGKRVCTKHQGIRRFFKPNFKRKIKR
jgi:hypothetical protein